MGGGGGLKFRCWDSVLGVLGEAVHFMGHGEG
jgi:hypothetical protein